jgi:ADP-heptose:LPS heptosyltransferase
LKALLVRLSSIGDVVHTLPCLAALRAHGWETGWIVEPPARSLLTGQPHLAHVTAAPAARAHRLAAARRAIRELKGHRYDVALDFQGLWKSAAWARFSGAARVVGFDRPWRREGLSAWLLSEKAELALDAPHIIDKNLALLRRLGIEAVGCREFPLPPTAREAEEVERRLAELGSPPFAILNPAGGWANKLWPPERYGEVAAGLRGHGLTALVTWGPGEQGLADSVVSASQGSALKCFPTTLLEFVELARRAHLVVAADTGPLHLACAVGTPVVGLFGPTDPARNGPFSSGDIVVRRTPLCAPCHRRKCRLHEGVMDAITPAEVLRAIERRLRSRA